MYIVLKQKKSIFGGKHNYFYKLFVPWLTKKCFQGRPRQYKRKPERRETQNAFWQSLKIESDSVPRRTGNRPFSSSGEPGTGLGSKIGEPGGTGLCSKIGEPGGTGNRPWFKNWGTRGTGNRPWFKNWGTRGNREPASVQKLGNQGEPRTGLSSKIGEPGGTGNRLFFISCRPLDTRYKICKT